ncbi:DNA-3-methyladenine glycosylase [Candidatus Dependentiae bacterium]|nr:MAG: DNA-3-methyladenine glycosylase [Candidatus Dependentiae bacterium]
MDPILDRWFYSRDTVLVARDLLGKLLVCKYNRKLLSGIIVETEGYRASDDPASHAYKGKTRRNAPMFDLVGYSYVYFIYGNHFCFNVVAKSNDQKAGAVLIRALEPLDGIEFMQKNRKQEDLQLLTNGPGKLTQALGISQDHNVLDLTKLKKLYIVDGILVKSDDVVTTNRIGIGVAHEKQWRFYLASNRWVSK